jgi:hypothetical protein
VVGVEGSSSAWNVLAKSQLLLHGLYEISFAREPKVVSKVPASQRTETNNVPSWNAFNNKDLHTKNRNIHLRGLLVSLWWFHYQALEFETLGLHSRFWSRLFYTVRGSAALLKKFFYAESWYGWRLVRRSAGFFLEKTWWGFTKAINSVNLLMKI